MEPADFNFNFPPLLPAARRLCVAFLDAPTIAKGAANYLVLAQNRVQSVFEFDVFDLDRMRDELAKAEDAAFPLNDDERAVVAGYDQVTGIEQYAKRVWDAVQLAKRYVVRESALKPEIDGSVPEFWVVFTEARFTREYYLARIDEVAVVTLGYWRTSMAPPSALEFIVRMTQVNCADFFLELPVHYFTKGCLLDFNEYIQDARLMVLVGNVCETCRQLSMKAGKVTELQALLELVDHEWIGDMTKSDSVASVLKKVYDYDLYVSRGLSVNRLETFWDNISSSSAQEFIRIVAAIILAFLLLKFGLKPGG